MKSIKFLPVLIVIASVLLSACTGSNISLAAPSSAAKTVQSAQANTAPASSVSSNSTAQSIPVSAPPANPQPLADVTSLQDAYEAIYQNVNPSVVTIVISSQVSTADWISRRLELRYRLRHPFRHCQSDHPAVDLER